MGSHVVDVGGKLHKSRVSSTGELLVDGNGRPLPVVDTHDYDVAAEQKGEGCNVHGDMVVKMVPGNFHVSCHGHPDLIRVFFSDKMMNVSHTIHNLSFGDKIMVDAAKGTNPLNDAQRVTLASGRSLLFVCSFAVNPLSRFKHFF